MTLAEALAVCDREYNDLVRSFTPEREQQEAETVLDETVAIMNSVPFHGIVQQAMEKLRLSESDIGSLTTTVSISIRFGMRVQRKLQSANAGKDLPAKDR